MKKIYVVCIALLVILISVSSVSAGMFDFLGGSADEKIVKIESEEPSLNGILKITEYKDVEKSGNDYTYEDFAGGSSNDILIENGEAEYKLHDDTKFFKVDLFIDAIELDKNVKDKSPMVTVKYLFNNDTKLSSSDYVLDDFCEVDFGETVYTVEGESVNLI